MCRDDATTDELREELHRQRLTIEEMNHRFRNQLQIISNLLDIQASRTSNAETLDALKQCRARVGSIAMVHDLLRAESSDQKIDIGQYLEALVAAIAVAWLGGNLQVKTEVSAAKISLKPARAAVVGLIVTELVTNALKHAFAADAKGRIGVEVRQEGSEIELVVSDDGCGLPEGLSIEASTAGGLRLVNALVAQLKGNVEFEVARGTKFTIVFPA